MGLPCEAGRAPKTGCVLSVELEHQICERGRLVSQSSPMASADGAATIIKNRWHSCGIELHSSNC